MTQNSGSAFHNALSVDTGDCYTKDSPVGQILTEVGRCPSPEVDFANSSCMQALFGTQGLYEKLHTDLAKMELANIAVM